MKTNTLIAVALLATFNSLTITRASIIFTSDVQGNPFTATGGDTLTGNASAENTANGIKVSTPLGPVTYVDTNGDGDGFLSLHTLVRTFDVIPESRIKFTLSVNGKFKSLLPGLVSITPDISELNNIGGDPYCHYGNIIIITERSAPLHFSQTDISEGETSEGGMELFGSFHIEGPSGFRIEFRFPHSIDASAASAVPESASTVGLLAIGLLGISLSATMIGRDTDRRTTLS